MFLPSDWSPKAWYVPLDEIDSVFSGFFSTGGSWADIWVANSPLDVLSDADLFDQIYRKTLFGRLDGKIASVRLLLESGQSQEVLSARFADPEDPMRKNLASLSESARRRIFLRPKVTEEEVFSVFTQTAGFCAVGGKLEPARKPLVFYRLSDPAHSGDRSWVLASPMRDGGMFNDCWQKIQRVFARTRFTSVSDLLSPQQESTSIEQSAVVVTRPREVRLLLVVGLSEEVGFCRVEWPELVPVDGAVRSYYEGVLKSKDGRLLYHVFLVRSSDMGNADAAVAAMAGLMQFSPDYVLLLGIAGGPKEKVKKLGTVVYGKSYEAYEYAKRERDASGAETNLLRPRPFAAGEKLKRMADDRQGWRYLFTASEQ